MVAPCIETVLSLQYFKKLELFKINIFDTLIIKMIAWILNIFSVFIFA